MRIYLTTALVFTLINGVTALNFTNECVEDLITDRTVSRVDYDVTVDSRTFYSHEHYDATDYPSDYSKCINIFTEKPDFVIKLEEIEFQLEKGYDGCNYDYLAIYYTSLDNAGTSNSEGRWCGDSGPGTIYSSGSRMFLYFYTDRAHTEKGFEFVISSLHYSDVPYQMSVAAIIGITFGVVGFVITIIIVACVVKSCCCQDTS